MYDIYIMTDRTRTMSAINHMRSSTNDMTARMQEAAKLHEKKAEFRDNMPDVTGQNADFQVRVKDRYSFYSMN